MKKMINYLKRFNDWCNEVDAYLEKSPLWYLILGCCKIAFSCAIVVFLMTIDSSLDQYINSPAFNEPNSLNFTLGFGMISCFSFAIDGFEDLSFRRFLLQERRSKREELKGNTTETEDE
jgi:hypothetical protein